VARAADQVPAAIDRRLAELDREWDVERVLEAESASMILLGLALGGAVHRRFFLLPVFAGSMVLVHALHGWYPLLPLFRRLGLRTREEIGAERNALKLLRGDFRGLAKSGDGAGVGTAHRLLEAARR
jgi:hypothetical protein